MLKKCFLFHEMSAIQKGVFIVFLREERGLNNESLALKHMHSDPANILV